MAKARATEAKFDRLQRIRRESLTPAIVAELRTALADPSNIVVAETAKIVGEQKIAELAADMVAAFDRLMLDPTETDPRCRAKIALAEALNQTEYDQPDVFLRGLTHWQEAGRPGDDDPAAPLRGISAFGLTRINHPGIVILLSDLLHDRAVAPRAAAARALGETRSVAALPLLRYKARLGDASRDVVEACLTGLMVAAPRDSLPFVACFLRGSYADGAVFALAESRLPDALKVLIEHWPTARKGDLGETLLLAIAMTRLPTSIDFLIDLLAKDKESAAAILSALAIHRHNDGIRDRVAVIVAQHDDAKITKRFEAKFA
jgi:HEAT repeat protein